jgi:cytochrome c553
MKRLSGLMLPFASMLWTGPSALGQEKPPAWAYPVNPPDFKAPPDDGTPRRVPNSNLTLTLTQVRDLFFSPDWHPGDHSPQPEVVARGRKPDVFACGFCHRADGPGGPENANLMGLPADYIKQQIADFKSGARKSSVMDRAPMSLKIKLAKAATDEEVALAAAYFASVKPHEVADDLERFVSRDARVTFTAYVPVGSIKKGHDLAARKDANNVFCGTCHGADLKGAGDTPGIVGRSPTYTFRQLYDYKNGARAGPGSAAMTPSVEKLTTNDMIALSAYLGSLAPY